MAKKDKSSWQSSGSTQAYSGAQRDWDHTSKRASRSLVNWRQLTRYLPFVMLLLLVGLALYLITRVPEKVPMLSYVVKTYKAPVPPNSLAQEDQDLQGKILGDSPKFNWVRNEKDGVSSSKYLKDLEIELSRMEPGGPDGNARIIYLSAHGVVNRHGEPCLLHSGASPSNCENWLTIKDLLDQIIRVNEASGKRRPNTLLLLDSGRIRDDWGLGILDNSFASRLASLLGNQKYLDHNIFVINSTGDTEVSYLAPELMGSVFGHFVTRGLYGEADGFNGAGRDDKVSALELSVYLQSCVNSWVDSYRGDIQVPAMYPQITAANDFQLAYATDDGQLPQSEAYRQYTEVKRKLYLTRAEARQKDLQDFWNEFATLEQSSAFRFDPSTWARLQQQIKRANQLIFAGEGYADQFKSLSGQIRNLSLAPLRSSHAWESETELRRGFQLPSSASLAMQTLRHADKPHDDALQKAWVQYITNTDYSMAATVQGDVQQLLEKRPETAEILPFVAWDSLLEDGLKAAVSKEQLHQQILHLSTLHATWLPGSSQLRSLEMELAHLLENLDWDAEVRTDLLSTPLTSALDQRDRIEKLRALDDARVQYWIYSGLNRVDRQWRTGLDQLFVGSAENLDVAESTLAKSRFDLDAVEKLAEQVREAYRLRDRTWAKLPYLWNWVLGQPFDDHLCQDLRALFIEAQDVHDSLVEPMGRVTQEAIDELANRASRLRSRLDAVEAKFALWEEDLTTGRSGSDQIVNVERRLSIPLSVSTADASATSGFEKLSREVLEQIRKRIGADFVYTDKDKSSESHDSRIKLRKWLASLKPHPVMLMLSEKARRIEAGTDGDEVIGNENFGDSDWAVLGGQVRDQLTNIEGECDQLAKGVYAALDKPADNGFWVRRKLADKANSTRALMGLLRDEEQRPEATVDLRHIDRQSQLLWQAESRLGDAWGPAYFDRSFRSLTAAASRQLNKERITKLDLTQRKTARISQLDTNRSELSRGIKGWVPFDNSTSVDPATAGQGVPVDHEFTVVSQQAPFPPGIQSVFYQTTSATNGTSLKTISENNRAVRRRGVDARKRARLRQSISASPNELKNMRLISWFRGHVVTKSLESNAQTELLAKAAEPRLTVTGRKTSTPYRLVFVLDCSSSMDDGGDYLTPAKEALKRLGPALKHEEIDVALVAYGHRFGFNNNCVGTKSQMAKSRGLEWKHVLADVETLVPPASLTDELTMRKWTKSLNNLQPWGQTPLYYAISQAMRLAADGDDKGHTIVITDGNQTIAAPGSCAAKYAFPDELSKALAQRSGEQVLLRQRFDKRDISLTQIDIVGLVGKANMEEEILNKITQSGQQKGRFRSEKIGDLEAGLRDLLGLPRFQIYRTGRNAPERLRDESEEETLLSSFDYSKTAHFGEQPGVRGPYEVRISPKDGGGNLVLDGIWLEGGEEIEINSTSLSPEKYPVNAMFAVFKSQEARRDLGNNPTIDPRSDYNAFPLVVRKKGTGYEFRVALQMKDLQRFTTRPPVVWMEIYPVIDGEKVDTPYYRFDRTFESNWGVPVIAQSVAAWPEEADEVEYSIWFEQPREGLPPTESQLQQHEVQLDRILDGKSVRHAGVEFTGKLTRAPGQPIRIVVLEQHGPESAVRFPLNVQLAAGKQVLEKRGHAFDEQSGIKRVRHEYEFAEGSSAEELKKSRLQLLTQDQIKTPVTGYVPVKVGPIRLKIDR